MKLKNYLLYSLLILASCMAEQNNPLVIGTCYDGLLNQNEEKVDCGGKCQKCQTILVPCKSSLVDNRITYKNVNNTFNASDIYSYQDYYNFKISVSKNNVEYNITLYVKALPTRDTIFPITNSYSPDDGYATINIDEYYYYYDYDASSGNVYVTYANKQWTIEFCSVPLSGISSTVSGRILYSK